VSPFPDPFDVVVVGGGPAGAAAARHLAGLGRSVLLLTRPRRVRLGESLPPSSRRILGALGLLSQVEEAGFLETTGNTVWWGARAADRQVFADGTGWQVDRSRLDELLLEGARSAGVQVREGGTVSQVRLPDGEAWTEGGGGALGEVTYREAGGQSFRARGRFILDASGRAGVLASTLGLRETTGVPRLTALVGLWSLPEAGHLSDPDHTWVESHDAGWVWSIPVEGGLRYVTAMVDPEAEARGTAENLKARYGRHLAGAAHLRRHLEGGRMLGSPWACGATPYGTQAFRGPGFLLVGDAGVFLDPLTSYGVKKALASGWLAAVTVHTALLDRSRRELALAFYEEREREVALRFHRQTRSFYREAAQAHRHPFWARRERPHGPGASTGEDAEETHGGIHPGAASSSADLHVDGLRQDLPDVRRPPEDRRVREAFLRLRQAEQVSLRPGTGGEPGEWAAVRDDEIVREGCLRTPSFPRGLRYLRGVDAVRLTALARGQGVPELYAAYCERDREVPLPDFLGALAVLLSEEVLVNMAEGPTDVPVGEPGRRPSFGEAEGIGWR
jgi:FAD-dependent halogenase